MAYALTVDVIKDDEVHMTYTFWGEDEAECNEKFESHQVRDPFLKAAVDEDRTIEELEDGVEIPEADADEEDRG